MDDEQRRAPGASCASANGCRKVGSLPQPCPGGEHGSQAESRERPLARRAERIARPARVRMRSRNPCVFARRRLLGWKVRLLTRRLPNWSSATLATTTTSTTGLKRQRPNNRVALSAEPPRRGPHALPHIPDSRHANTGNPRATVRRRARGIKRGTQGATPHGKEPSPNYRLVDNGLLSGRVVVSVPRSGTGDGST
jgi:hypothetical protein